MVRHTDDPHIGRAARAGLVVVLLAAVVGSMTLAEEPKNAGRDDPAATSSVKELARQILELKQQIARLSEAKDTHIQELEKRVAELEKKLQEAQQRQEEASLEALRREAGEAVAGQAEKEEKAEAQRETATGRARNLQALNPEISFLGDISYDASDSPDIRNQFLLRGAEIGFQSPLDPYTRFKAFLAAHQEPPEFEVEATEPAAEEDHEHAGEIGVSLEEAYMEWVALPGNTRLRVGRFRQQFGTLNRWHQHALPSTDVPFALRDLFGHEGLVGLGVGVDWQLPGLWATSNGLTVEITNADNENALAGSHFRDPAFLLRHTGFFDLGPDAYFELGLTGMTGANDESGDHKTTAGSVDFNYVWEPVNRSKYRGLEVRGEFIHSRFETDTAPVKADSWYTYVTWKLARRWIVGMRYDDAELPVPRVELLDGQTFREGLSDKGWTGFLTFWQSEFVRLRGQYQHASRDFVSAAGPRSDDRLWLQVTFAAGPHKHESY